MVNPMTISVESILKEVLVNNLNSVIAYVDDSEGDDLDKQYIKGQALAMVLYQE